MFVKQALDYYLCKQGMTLPINITNSKISMLIQNNINKIES